MLTIQHFREADYEKILRLQEEYRQTLIEKKKETGKAVADAYLLLVEHTPVYTTGRAFKDEHILGSFQNNFDKEQSLRTEDPFLACHPEPMGEGSRQGFSADIRLDARRDVSLKLNMTQIPIYHLARGGSITYHGLGQLVIYPILDLHYYQLKIDQYIRRLEELIIHTLASFGIQGFAIAGKTGVWVSSSSNSFPKKIAAIGVQVRSWITMHGVALNINPDLKYFGAISPCGLSSAEITSMAELFHPLPDWKVVAEAVVANFHRLFVN